MLAVAHCPRAECLGLRRASQSRPRKNFFQRNIFLTTTYWAFQGPRRQDVAPREPGLGFPSKAAADAEQGQAGPTGPPSTGDRVRCSHPLQVGGSHPAAPAPQKPRPRQDPQAPRKPHSRARNHLQEPRRLLPLVAQALPVEGPHVEEAGPGPTAPCMPTQPGWATGTGLRPLTGPAPGGHGPGDHDKQSVRPPG